MFDVEGRGALVTGGASGIGLAMSTVLAESGAKVTIADANSESLERAVADLRARSLEVRGVQVDVADWRSIDNACAEAVDAYGRLDIVIANAGISAGPGPLAGGALDELDETRWRDVLDINLSGVLATVRAAAIHIREGDSGRVIVTTSVAGLRAEPIVGYAYAASKSALVGLVRQAAPDLARKGIRINGIAPHGFRTNIGGGRASSPELMQYFVRGSVFGRMADPSELRGLTLLLASDASSYMTGAIFTVDGGSESRQSM